MSNKPPIEVPQGAIRLNTDSQKLEYWMGSAWMQIKTFSPNLDGNGGRGCATGGYTGPGSSGNTAIDFFNIESAGNAADFGDLSDGRWAIATGASNTRGIFAGGDSPGDVNTVDFITISSTGSRTDFGDIGTGGHRSASGVSNQTRMVAAGGDKDPHPNQMNTINFVTIASTGNFIDSGGDLQDAKQSLTNSINSPIRGIFSGGFTPSAVTRIEFINISTMGNGQDFGTLSSNANTEQGTVSSSTRGLIKISIDGTNSDQVDTLQITTLGDSVNFGNLSDTRTAGGPLSSCIRGIFAGGRVTPAEGSTVIDYMNIATGGDAVDFGDLNFTARNSCGLSNAHGGL